MAGCPAERGARRGRLRACANHRGIPNRKPDEHSVTTPYSDQSSHQYTPAVPFACPYLDARPCRILGAPAYAPAP